MKNKFDKKMLENSIKTIAKEIQNYKNPEELNEIKKAIKKNVPFSLRSYFSAYLLLQSGIASKSMEFTSLFVSIGKNKKIYPKDLINFFSEEVKIPANSFGKAVIRDKYSFIEVPSADADDIICAINGKTLKGWTLTVNYSKKNKK